MWQVIGAFLLHAVIIAGENGLVLIILALTFIAIFYIGRLIERHQWCKEIKDGTRLGELVQEQLKKRDGRIGKLTREMAQLETWIEQVGIKHRRMVGLSQEIINISLSEDTETLGRRRRV